MADDKDKRDRARGCINEIIDTLVKRARAQRGKWEPDLERVFCSVFKRARPEHHRLKPTHEVTWALLFGINGVNRGKYLGPHAIRDIQTKHVRYALATLKELDIFYDDSELGDAPSTWFPAQTARWKYSKKKLTGTTLPRRLIISAFLPVLIMELISNRPTRLCWQHLS